MLLHIGTSGFSYKEWKGSFYPADLPQAKMLAFYAERFSTVEINNTFYRMPNEGTLAGWTRQVPAAFRFVLKAPQRITHQKKLADAGDDVRRLFDAAAALGDHLGPVLFQLPPYLRADAARLEAFLGELPEDRAVAFEFRHASWDAEPIRGTLAGRRIAVCAADTDESPVSALPPATAPWGYLRLRRAAYEAADLERWAERIAAQPWEEAWVFFKHEEEGKGPAFARMFAEAAGRIGLALA